MILTSEKKNYLSQMECRDMAKQIRTQIGVQIATARLNKGWTLEEAAKNMFNIYHYSFGMHTLERIELGKHDLKLWDIILLSRLYDMSLGINIATLSKGQ